MVKLIHDLKQRLFGEEEEAEAGGVDFRDDGGDGDGGDCDRDGAAVGESEFFEEDHGTVVGLDL